jgi:hypothetical protein
VSASFVASFLLVLFLGQFGSGGESSTMSPLLNPQSSRPSAMMLRRRQIKMKRNYYIDGVTPKPAKNKANAIRSPVFSDATTRYLDSSNSNSSPSSSFVTSFLISTHPILPVFGKNAFRPILRPKRKPRKNFKLGQVCVSAQ